MTFQLSNDDAPAGPAGAGTGDQREAPVIELLATDGREGAEPSPRHVPRSRFAAGFGVVGGLLVAASFLVDWRQVDLVSPNPGQTILRIHIGIADLPTFGVGYLLSGIVLLTLVSGAVTLPPAVASRVRTLGLVWAVAFAVIVAIIVIRLNDNPGRLAGGLLWPFLVDGSVGLEQSWGPGVPFGALGAAALGTALVLARPAPAPGTDIAAREPDGGG